MTAATTGKRATSARRNGSEDRGRGREEEFLRVAIALFYRQGFAATSMQHVADAMGILKGSLYYYVDSKDDLLRRIFEDNHAGASEIVERVRALDVPAVQRLATFLVEYAEWFLVNLERTTVYQREWRYLTGDFREEVSKQRAYYDAFLAGLIEEATRAGDIAPDTSARRLGYFILSAITGLPDWYHREGSDTPRAVAESYAVLALRTANCTTDVAALVRGIGGRKSVPARKSRARSKS